MARFSEKFFRQGFSTVELLLAFALITLTLTFTILVVFQVEDSSFLNSYRIQAGFAVRSAIDRTIILARQDFNSIISTTTLTGGFSLEQKVQNTNEFTKNILFNISSGGLHSTSTQFLRVTDRTGAVGGSSCLIQNWSVTHIGGTVSIPNVTSTDIDARNGYVYMTVNSSVGTSSDLYIIDVHNPQNPFIVSSIHTGPGLNSVHVAGHYAYVANTSINAQLQVIDISNPSSPHLISSYKLPGVYNDGTTIGNTILFYKSHVYLGTQKSQIAELHDIDVSNPAAPVEVATWEANAAINALSILPPYLFVGTPLNSEITVLDISRSLAVAGSFDAPGGSGNGKSLAFHDDKIFLGRTIGGNELYFLSALHAPALEPISFKNINTSVTAIVASGDFAFLGTTDNQKEFQIWDVHDPRQPTLASSVDLPNRVVALDCDISTMYAAILGSDVLRIFYSEPQ